MVFRGLNTRVTNIKCVRNLRGIFQASYTSYLCGPIQNKVPFQNTS
jgi:hypothetical protein